MATKKDIAEYTAEAQRGFDDMEFVGLWTSAMHACWCIGNHLRDTGRPAPRDVRPGRGDLVHANDMLFRLDWRNVKYPNIYRER